MQAVTLRLVGEVVHRALKLAVDMAQPDMPVAELCERVESFIRANGASPAFPVNVGINSVAAHYTAKRGDSLRLPRSGLVKIDVGAHRDGYIVDAAVTVAFGSPYDAVAKAAREALRAVQDALRPGMRAWQVGEIVERVARSSGLKPIYNLTGHRIERFMLHAGAVVPNYPDKSASQAFEPGDVYAVEPFVTNGEGHVEDGKDITIFRLLRMRHREFQDLIDAVSSVAGPLPFAPRWFPKLDEGAFLAAMRAGVMYGYRVLVERGGGLVGQFEDTYLFTEDGAVPLAKTLEV